jgi:hypothetical protein
MGLCEIPGLLTLPNLGFETQLEIPDLRSTRSSLPAQPLDDPP